MKFLADENFPSASIQLLRQSGYDVLAISETSPGVTDQVVLQLAVRQNCVILTFDRDYGELIFRFKILPPVGVIYLRYDPSFPTEPAEHIQRLLAEDLF